MHFIARNQQILACILRKQSVREPSCASWANRHQKCDVIHYYCRVQTGGRLSDGLPCQERQIYKATMLHLIKLDLHCPKINSTWISNMHLWFGNTGKCAILPISLEIILHLQNQVSGMPVQNLRLETLNYHKIIGKTSLIKNKYIKQPTLFSLIIIWICKIKR
jgi:hypothetical protein